VKEVQSFFEEERAVLRNGLVFDGVYISKCQGAWRTCCYWWRLGRSSMQ